MDNIEELKILGKSCEVQEMYSEHAPYPGHFIRLFADKNFIRKAFYTLLARRFMFNPKDSYKLIRERYKNFAPRQDAAITFLDAGCGTGENTLQFGLAYPNAEVVGIDISDGSLGWARKLQEYWGIKNVKFIKKDYAEGSLDDLGKFDMIHCCGSLHHTNNPQKALGHLKDALKTECSLLWIFLYGDFGRHLENKLRKGLRLIFPKEGQLKKRFELAKKMKLDRRTLNVEYRTKIGSLIRLRWKKDQMLDNLKHFGLFYFYGSRSKDTDIYDAFAHSIVRYYDTGKIKALAESADLNLINFDVYPKDQIVSGAHIEPYLESKDIFQKMEIVECFQYPQSFYLIFRKKK